MEDFKLNTIEEAIADFREGKFIIVVDDEDRENEGDFIIAAEKITPEKVNFMLKEGRGVLCAPITLERCAELELEKQVSNNTSILGTPFTVTIDKFLPDPDVRGAKAYSNDYTKSGYDRGHMAPAADMKWSKQAMAESFYMSNICPQKPQPEPRRLEDLEEKSRQWAKKYGAVYIACGPVYDHGKPKRI